MATYYSVSSPAVAAGFLISAESRVLMGTEYLYGSLDTSSWTYTTYRASIGLKAGKSIDLGLLESLSFSHVPSFEAVEAANVSDSGIWLLTGEETTVSIGLRQFDPRILEIAFGTGRMYNLGNERLITFGGACSILSRPISIEFANISCTAPTSENINTGVSMGVLTLYDCICTSGVPWDDINASAINNLGLEFKARPVLAHARGNRLGCLYLA